MLTILIADDEKLERNGIKFLLKREKEEFQIIEAVNGKDALGVLASHHVDLLLTDVKMPYMNGLELSAHVKENYPEVEIVIFSGYNDFSYAREALRYGVVDYVLKPVDPEEFHKTMSRVTAHIREHMADRERQDRQEDYLKKYFLLEWLYTESGRSRENLEALTEDPGDILNRCTRMILAGSANAFFETEEEHFIGNLKERIQREFYYINLNSNESLFLFAEKYTDYAQVAESLYQFFAQQYDSECYFAVSREVQGWQDFPAEFRELENLMSGQFYQPAKHVAVNGEKDDPAAHVTEPDSELTEQISRDIRYKDAVRLRQDFRKLEKKYRHEKKFSEMYVKFVFSGIVKDIYEEFPELGEKPLARKVERIYRCRQIGDILDIVDDAVCEFESCLSEQQDGIRREVAQVKNYILHHYSEGNLSPDHLGAMVYLSPGYLSTVFKEETGVTINRYVREVRMNKAKELLENTNMKISAISSEVGFSSSTYFCRSFREFFGVSPESCRKGQTADEAAFK